LTGSVMVSGVRCQVSVNTESNEFTEFILVQEMCSRVGLCTDLVSVMI
jgi:hypothetical protein